MLSHDHVDQCFSTGFASGCGILFWHHVVTKTANHTKVNQSLKYITWIIMESKAKSFARATNGQITSLLIINGIFYVVVVTQCSTKIVNHIYLYAKSLNNSPGKTTLWSTQTMFILIWKVVLWISQLCMILYPFSFFFTVRHWPIFESRPASREPLT